MHYFNSRNLRVYKFEELKHENIGLKRNGNSKRYVEKIMCKTRSSFVSKLENFEL